MGMTTKRSSGSGLSRREILKYGLYGGLAAGLSPGLWLGGCRKQQNGKRPNIILMTLDTTRADRLSCYGYKRKTSPNLDKLAEESVLYTQAIAPSSWTLPSHASLFTGKFTTSHGARYDPEGPLRLNEVIQASPIYRARGLAQDELTLAEILKNEGYVTAAVVGGPWMKRIFGLDKGFDFYDDSEISSYNGRLAEQVTASAVTWIKQSRKKDFFLFLNYFDPHAPCIPPEGFMTAFLAKDIKSYEKQLSKEEDRELQNALYDAEILYMDDHIGQLLKELKGYNLYENTWIIVTADHGELLGEHGKFGHGQYLYQEELHIPLFMKHPGGEVPASQSSVRVQLTDILPIILKRLEIPVPSGIQGDVPPQTSHPILAEVYPLPLDSNDGDWRAIFEGDFKFIWNSKGRHQLFNLANDPAETVNLAERESRRAARMLSEMNRYLLKLPGPGPATPPKELDENTRKALKSLGYVN
jgi:arylsulfatase A-like enzyme